MADWIGYRWLAREYGVDPVQPFPVTSQIGRARATTSADGISVETYGSSFRPVDTLSGHLTFALRHEGIHLEFLARLFAQVPAAEISEWVNREPSGQYSRRSGFLYEWLTGRSLDFPGVIVGNYVLALSADEYLTAVKPTNVPRWRVRNNLIGTRAFCPTVRRTPQVQAFETYDCRAKLTELEDQFGADILARSAVWLTIKESRASFRIEHEEAQASRIKRFASVMEQRCGTAADPLDSEFLGLLQAEILGESALRKGLRKSPVFIGEAGLTGEVVHYVAPHWDDLAAMLEGLRAFAELTAGQPSLVRAAVMSFGFVYVHPMADGNGRISRFLVNDTLRRDGAAPAPFILPISSTITRTVARRAAYDLALERFSRPFMDHFGSACHFGADVVCEDGIRTNFRFSAYEEAKFPWAYPDLTTHVEYLGEVIRDTIETEMQQEAGFLLELRQARERVKEVLEAPDVELDRIIRSIKENSGVVSGKLASEFPRLADSGLARAVAAAVVG